MDRVMGTLREEEQIAKDERKNDIMAMQARRKCLR